MREVQLGDVIDDYCVKCKRIMNHSVVSMLNREPAKVRCRTCHSDHDYRHEQAPPPKVDLRKQALFNAVLEKVAPTEAEEQKPKAKAAKAKAKKGRVAARSLLPFVLCLLPFDFLFWFFAGPALILAFLSLRGERKRARYVAARLFEPSSAPLPAATVIVPVKGEDPGLRDNLAALASLDYPDYELIVVAREAADIPPGVLPRRAKVVLAHGHDPHTGEKIQNLLAAVRAARKSSQVFAFADSDGRVARTWLRALVGPLAEEGVGAATGYRWYLPEPPDFWSLVRSVWNATIAGTLGPGPNAFAWGGAMAIRKETFSEIRVPEFWRNSVSDDYALSAAVRQAGLAIVFAPGAMAASTDRTSARAFFAWARRQMILTRVCRPRLWWTALAAHVFYCGGMAASIAAAALGHRAAEWALLAQLGPGMLKGLNRAALAKAELPDHRAWFDRHTWVHAWWTPLVTWIWLAVLISSALTNEIEWRGNRYEL